jgi:hypothetical protein
MLNNYHLVRFHVFMAVTMKNAVLWDVDPVKTDVSEEHIVSIFQVKTLKHSGSQRVCTSQQTVKRTSCNGDSLSFQFESREDIFLRNFVLTRATRRQISEDNVLQLPPYHRNSQENSTSSLWSNRTNTNTRCITCGPQRRSTCSRHQTMFGLSIRERNTTKLEAFTLWKVL